MKIEPIRAASRRRIAAGAAGVLILLVLIGAAIQGAARERPPEPRLPASKRADLARERRLAERAADVPKEKLARKVDKDKELVDSDWPTGIFENGEYPSDEFEFVNRWVENLKNEHITVLAGSYTADPQQGLVLVQTASLDLKKVVNEPFPTPAKAGSVRITAVDGMTVFLEAADGSRFTFNARSRRYE